MNARLAIVMPVLNRVHFVRRAIESVIDQHVDGIQIIAVDGGSTDGTQEAISSYGNVQLLQAPNSTIYQALNIGIKSAQAPIIGHLNSDDRIPAGALPKIIAAAADNPGFDIWRGQALFVAQDAGGGVQRQPRREAAVAAQPDVAAVLFGAPAINTCFIRAATYQRLGLYDETLRIAADREWLLRAVLLRATICALDFPVYEYLVHTASLTISDEQAGEGEYAREHLAIAERYLASQSDPAIVRTLREWQAYETVRLLVRGRGKKDWYREVARVFRVSPSWPILAVPSLLRFVRRRWRLRSNAE